MLCRPAVVHDSPVALPLAGIYVSCIIPKLLRYEHIEAAYESCADSPLHSHFMVEEDDEATDSPDSENVGKEDGGGDDDDTEESVLVKGGEFVVSRRRQPPSPSFGDLLLSKRTYQSTPYEVRFDGPLQ